MASSGQVVENPRRKERVTFVRTAQDTDGELLEMLVQEEPTSAHPPLHCHPHQQERMEVISGVLDYRLGDRVSTASPGEVVVVEKGAAHTWWNSGSEPLVVRAELSPALGFETFMETIYGLTKTGRVNRDGVPNLLQAAVLFRAFRREWVPLFLPRPVRELLIPILALAGKAFGYRAWYPEFSPSGPASVPPSTRSRAHG